MELVYAVDFLAESVVSTPPVFSFLICQSSTELRSSSYASKAADRSAQLSGPWLKLKTLCYFSDAFPVAAQLFG